MREIDDASDCAGEVELSPDERREADDLAEYRRTEADQSTGRENPRAHCISRCPGERLRLLPVRSYLLGLNLAKISPEEVALNRKGKVERFEGRLLWPRSRRNRSAASAARTVDCSKDSAGFPGGSLSSVWPLAAAIPERIDLHLR